MDEDSAAIDEREPAAEAGDGAAQNNEVQTEAQDAAPSDPIAEDPIPEDPGAAESGSALEEVLAVDELRSRTEALYAWAEANLFTIDVAIQCGLIVAALVPTALFAPRLKEVILSQLAARAPSGVLKRAAQALAVLAAPIALYITLNVIRLGLGSAGRPIDIVSAAISLMTAWIIIRLVTLVIRSHFWSRVAFYVAWPIAALDVFGALDNVVAQMQALAIPLGENSAGEPIGITLLDVVRTLIYFGVLFWGASFVGGLLQNRIENIEELTPSLKALIVKIMNVILPVLALLIALQIVGFNLGTLTVFGGAIGLGIGLGLQKLVANFIAGFTLIADKSIKPNDVIEIDDTFGWVTSMQARYVAIRTRDGTEHLIPNDRFMADGVVNWSRLDRVVRIHAPFGVAYGTDDLRFIQSLAVDAAKAIERVVETPAPVCNLIEFGDNSVNFDLRFWIRDPQNGIGNVRSAVLLEIWDRLKANDIEIPFPQRDLHIKSWPEEGGARRRFSRKAD
ncbi:MAG: mechanosensitive ion channel domain-containing protein [Pseudomonadota bacterium]